MNANRGEVLLYQAADGGPALDVQIALDTVWLTQAQMAELFGRERSVITKHINNVFKEGELDRDSVCANFAHTADDGKTFLFNILTSMSPGGRRQAYCRQRTGCDDTTHRREPARRKGCADTGGGEPDQPAQRMNGVRSV